MNKLFDDNNPLMRGMSAAADLLFLNLLTLLCSLPLLTVGAALSALCDAVQRMVREEDGQLVRGYFRAFKTNLRKGSALGLLFAAAAGLVWLDYRLAGVYAPPLRLAAAAVGVLLLGLALYAFALQARFENSVAGTLKNAAALMAAYFPTTLWMLVCTLALWILALRFLRYALPLLLMFGLSLPCYVCALLYQNIFRSMEKDSDETR